VAAFVFGLGVVGFGSVVLGALYTAVQAVLRRFDPVRSNGRAATRRGESGHPHASFTAHAFATGTHFQNIVTQEAACGAEPLHRVSTTLDPSAVTCPACLAWVGQRRSLPAPS
jgi:hypothetical protein